MKLFSKKQLNMTAEEYRAVSKLHLGIVKSQMKTFLLTGVCTVASLLTIGVLTVAWFSANDQVRAENVAVSTEAPFSLYIEKGDLKASGEGYQDRYNYTTSIDTTVFSGNLYPISTMNIENWWYVTGWNGAKADTYEKAILSQNMTYNDRYDYTYNTKTYTAYNVAEYTVYCTEGGEMNLYLDPDGSITLTNTGENYKELKKALRIGVAVDDVMKFIYCPDAETISGNSNGTVAEKYYAVTGANSVAENSNVITDLSDYMASLDGDGFVPGSISLAETDYDGVKISIYAWIEGTDGEAIVGKSDNASGVNVSFHLVGIQK